MPKPSAARRATRLADAAETEDAQRLAVHVPAEQVFADVARPAAFAHQAGQLDQAPAGRHDEREDRVGGGFGQHAGRVAQHDAARCQRVQRVVVDADRDAGDDLRAAARRPAAPRRSGSWSRSGPAAVASAAWKAGSCSGQARVGDGHVVPRLQPCQLVGRQFAEHQHLLAVGSIVMFTVLLRSVRRGSAGLRCRPAPAPRARQSRRRASPRRARCRPSSSALITPTAKPSPAPTVSITFGHREARHMAAAGGVAVELGAFGAQLDDHQPGAALAVEAGNAFGRAFAGQEAAFLDAGQHPVGARRPGR